MARTAEHSEIIGIKRIHMTGAAESGRRGLRIGKRTDGGTTVLYAHPGRTSLEFVHSDREGVPSTEVLTCT